MTGAIVRLRRRAPLAGLSGAFVVEPRLVTPPLVRLRIVLTSVVGALLLGAVLLVATGNDPVEVYETIVTWTFGSPSAFAQTLILTTPLVLTGLATAVAFRMRLWSIGGEGQLIIGAILASGFALTLGEGLPAALLIPMTLLTGCLGGAIWAGIAGAARAYLRTDEVISTLILNYIAIYLMSYLVIGSHSMWRDAASGGQPMGTPLPPESLPPLIFEQADIGILIAVAVAVATWAGLKFTRWGYGVEVVAGSPRAARYAGINVARKIVVVMLVSGALAGLAGAIQVTAVTQALDPAGLSPDLGLGYTGIVVAALARFRPLAIVPVAFLIATLLSAGPPLSLVGVPGSIVIVLQGLLLVLLAGGQFHLAYRIRRVRDSAEPVGP